MKRVVVVSLVAHAALFAWLARRPAPVSRVAPAGPIDEIALEMETAPEALALPEPAAPRELVAVIVARPGTAPSGPSGVAPIPSGLDVPLDTAPYASNGTIIVFAPNIGVTAGVSGSNPFLVSGVDAGGGRVGGTASADPLYVPLEKRAEQSVKDALRARDQHIGLGLEGPVVSALEGATHAGFAPDRGSATFLAVIDDRGLVIDLKVLSSSASSSDGARGWEEVRRRAVKSLATARIEMRGVKRAELKIAVESEVLLPSGNQPGKPFVPTGKPTTTRIESNAPPSPGNSDTVVSVEVGRFDVTDIGADKQRVVHAKLLLVTTR